MKFKQIWKQICTPVLKTTLINIIRFSLLGVFIFILLFVVLKGINVLLPLITNAFKLCNISTPDLKLQTASEISSNITNFSIVYITVLFTIMGTVVAFVATWWHNSLKKLEKCHQDYKKFQKDSPLETRLITAKIFFIQKDFAEAWNYIEDLPEDLTYEVPLYKARILMNQPHDEPVFFTVMKLLNKALSFPQLTKEAKAVIYRSISTAYLEEKKDYERALEFAEKAISEDSIYWSAHIEKGRALKRLGLNRLDEAIETLEKIITEDKTYDNAYFNLACYYSLKAEKETSSSKKAILKNTAIGHCKKSIKLNPKYKKLARTDDDLKLIKDNIREDIENS